MAKTGTSSMRPLALSVPEALHQRFEHNGLVWLNFRYPVREQIEALQTTYPIHPLHMDDILSRSQRPKLDEDEAPAYLFLVLHFPVFDHPTRMSIVSEVDILVGPDFVITTHDGRLKPLIRLVQSAAEPPNREQLMGRGSGYLLYRILDTLVKYCFPMLLRLDEKLDRIEELMFLQQTQQIVEDLSYIRRDIISLRRIIRPNLPVLRSLAAVDRPYLGLDTEGAAYFGDVTDGLTRIWDMLEEQKEIIEGLDATLFSLTSHRINQEIKIFTLISVVMLPMTLIASIYGMNVHLPLAETPLAFWGILVLMGIVAGGLFLFFRHRRWV
jgi:magnesium transporter